MRQMSRPPSPNTPDAVSAGRSQAAEEPTCHLDARYCPPMLPFARGDLQQDIIDMLKPVDNDRLQEGMPDTEFNRKYPPDAWCEEGAPNARVWKICRDEATASDRDMLESWNKTLDVLLIFAGLFSAVSTAFIIESYKTLQLDYSQYVAMFLYSAAVAYNSSGNALPPLDIIRSPEGSFRSTTIERWINGLWFISLTISLLVALLSILIKQWLDEYRARVSRSAPYHAYWTRRRTLYYNGLRSWGVPVLISFLPLLLHVSLFLFLAGLVLFLQLLDAVIARAVLVILALLLGLYLLSMVLPAFYLDCPSKTPVLRHALHAWWGFIWSLDPFSWLARAVSLYRYAYRHGREEESKISVSRDELDASAVAELVTSTDDPDVMTVVAEALGDFDADLLNLLKRASFEVHMRLRQCILKPLSHGTVKSGFEVASYARCRRSQIAFDITFQPPSTSMLTTELPDLRVALGIEGALLSILEQWEPTFTTSCGIRNLVAALRNMHLIPALHHPGVPDDSIRPGPRLHLSFCLRFLETTARIVELSDSEWHLCPLSHSPHFYSVVMLVFCHAQFASGAYTNMANAAARSLVTVVFKSGDECRNATPNGSSRASVDEGKMDKLVRARSRSIDTLYTMLAHTEQYNIHPDVADSVAPYIFSLATGRHTLWADCNGLSDFILSVGFERFTTSVEGLAIIAQGLARVSLHHAGYDPQSTSKFLLCASTLASRASSLQFSPEQYYYSLRGSLRDVLSDLWYKPRKDNEFVILSHFLSDTTVLERWMEIFWYEEVGFPSHRLETRTLLVDALACALRRRSRMNLEVRPEWTRLVFSNGHLVRIAESALDIFASGDHPADRGWADPDIGRAFVTVKRFLAHWRQLSPSSWASMCDHLHNSRAGSGVVKKDIERFSGGRFPGDADGALAIDCDKATARVSTAGGWRDRWGQRLKRLQPGVKRERPRGETGRSTVATEV